MKKIGFTDLADHLGKLLTLSHVALVKQDESSSYLAKQIDEIHQWLATLRSEDAPDTEIETVRQELIGLKRELRDGGQLRPGDILADRYHLRATIGYGGFGTVWKAYDYNRRQFVAVKVLHTQWAASQERHDRFFRGAREMGYLDHPHIKWSLHES